jgi:fermentation-respiration switch protein FrsA (DUF1100 family)
MGRGAILPAVLLLLAVPGLAAPEPPEGGVFTVYAGGIPAGTEVCTVSRREGLLIVESRAELVRDDRRQVLDLTLVLEDGTRQIRSFRARGEQAGAVREYDLAARDGTLRGRVIEGGETRELSLPMPEGAVVVAEPFFVPWLLVLGRDDGGEAARPRTVPAVFPLREKAGVLRLTPRGPQALEIDGRAVLARQTLAEPEHGEAANLWVDERGRLLVCALSVLGISAVRGETVVLGLAPGEDPPDPEGTVSQRVRFSSNGVTLGGTFLRPAAGSPPWPAVLMVSGSGPHDRNGNVPRTELQWNLLHSFSVALALRGIASLRYDERGVGSSGGTFYDAGLSDLVADARSALGYLASRGDVKGGAVGLLGHSEGALIGAALAGGEGGPDALALLGAPAEPLDRILLGQAGRRAVAEGVDERERDRILADMRALFEHVLLSDSDLVRWNGRARHVRWLREHLRLDPLALFSEVSCPTLVLQGEADLQVPATHARRVHVALGSQRKELARIPGAGHFLMRADGDRRDYAETRRTVRPEALATVGAWFRKCFRIPTESPK